MSAEEPTIFPGGRGTITTNTGGENPAWHQPVSFPDWRAVLDLEPLEEATRARYAKSIIAYLGYLKKLHERATVAGAKKFLEEHADPGPSGASPARSGCPVSGKGPSALRAFGGDVAIDGRPMDRQPRATST